MTIFGIFIFAVTFYSIIKHKNIAESFTVNFAIYCSVYIFYALGYYYHITNFELDNEEWLCLVLFIQSIILISRSNHIKVNIHSVILIFSIIIGAVWLYIFPYTQPVYVPGANEYAYITTGSSMVLPSINGQSARFFIRVVMHMAIVSGFVKIINNERKKHIITIIYKAAMVNYIYIAFELVCKVVLHSRIYQTFQILIFGQTSVFGSNVNRIGIPILTGFWSESTQLSAGIFVFALIAIYSEKNTKHRSMLIIVSIIVLLLSGSFRGFMSFAAITSLYYLQTRTSSKKVAYILAALFGVFMFYMFVDTTYYTGRLISSFDYILGKEAVSGVSGSEYVRFKTIKDAFAVFIKRPLFGLGIATIWCYATIPALLSNTGLIGTISYFKFISTKIRYTVNKYFVIDAILLVVVYTFSDTFSAVYNPALFFALYLLGKRSIEYKEENNIHGAIKRRCCKKMSA